MKTPILDMRKITSWGTIRPSTYKRDGSCSHCGGERTTLNRYCRNCHADYQRHLRPKHSDLTDEQRQRSICRAYANVYQRRGKLVQKLCEKCGDHKSEKHHNDYNKPLEVTWLCRKCHLSFHRVHS